MKDQEIRTQPKTHLAIVYTPPPHSTANQDWDKVVSTFILREACGMGEAEAEKAAEKKKRLAAELRQRGEGDSHTPHYAPTQGAGMEGEDDISDSQRISAAHRRKRKRAGALALAAAAAAAAAAGQTSRRRRRSSSGGLGLEGLSQDERWEPGPVWGIDKLQK